VSGRVPLALPARFETPLLLALLLALLAASALLSALGRPLVTPVSPSGIIAFELAGTAERAGEILASWDDAARRAARTQTFWDYVLYIPVYVVALSVWAAWAARRAGRPGWSRVGVVLAWAMLAAGALDAIENWQLLAQLAHGPDGGRAALAAVCAAIKFAIVLATIAYGLGVTALVALRALRRERA
jgi:hypothetical protein